MKRRPRRTAYVKNTPLRDAHPIQDHQEGRKVPQNEPQAAEQAIMETPELIFALFQDLRDLLRRNGDWNVKLSLHAIYGTIGMEVYHFNSLKHSEHGVNLYKRLMNAMEYLYQEGVR